MLSLGHGQQAAPEARRGRVTASCVPGDPRPIKPRNAGESVFSAPAEAMACGCIVIGYSGNGGEEYFKDEFSFKINAGDLITYAKILEQIVNEYADNPERLDQLRKCASDFILTNYTKENTEASLMRAWLEINK